MRIVLRQREIERAALALRLPEQIHVHPVFAALEIEVDRCGGTAHAGRAAEHGIVGADLLAHDDDLLPLAGGRAVAGGIQRLRGLQEHVLVAPDEIDLQKLQAQVPTVGLALERDAHQIGGLIVQAIGHVEIGLGQGIALVDVHGAFARQRVLGRLEAAGVHDFGRRRREFPHGVLARFLHHEGLGTLASHAELGGRIARIGDVRVLHQPADVGVLLVPSTAHRGGDDGGQHERQQGHGHPPIGGHPVDPRTAVEGRGRRCRRCRRCRLHHRRRGGHDRRRRRLGDHRGWQRFGPLLRNRRFDRRHRRWGRRRGGGWLLRQLALQRTELIAADIEQPLGLRQLGFEILDAALERGRLGRRSGARGRRGRRADTGHAAARGGRNETQMAAGGRRRRLTTPPGVHLTMYLVHGLALVQRGHLVGVRHAQNRPLVQNVDVAAKGRRVGPEQRDHRLVEVARRSRRAA